MWRACCWFCSVAPNAWLTRSKAFCGSWGCTLSADRSSIAVADNPWDRVSWISPASLWRSFASTACSSAAASRACVRCSSRRVSFRPRDWSDTISTAHISRTAVADPRTGLIKAAGEGASGAARHTDTPDATTATSRAAPAPQPTPKTATCIKTRGKANHIAVVETKYKPIQIAVRAPTHARATARSRRTCAFALSGCVRVP